MKYLVLLKYEFKEYDLFMQLGQTYELGFHPNLTDEIVIDDYDCSIERILMGINDDPDDSSYNHLHLIVNDPQYVCDNRENAIECLNLFWKENEEYGWHVNDYSLGVLAK